MWLCLTPTPPPAQVRQEPDLSTALGYQKRSHHGLFHWVYLAHHLPVLWSGLLVWFHSSGRHWRVHTRNFTAGIAPPKNTSSVFFNSLICSWKGIMRLLASIIYHVDLFLLGLLWSFDSSHEFGSGLTVSGGICCRSWSCYNHLWDYWQSEQLTATASILCLKCTSIFNWCLILTGASDRLSVWSWI